jgi:hypothetical protein
MDLKEIACEVVDRVEVAQNVVQWWAFVNTVTKLREFLDHLSYSQSLK